MPLNVLTCCWSFRQKSQSVIQMHLLIHSSLAHKAQPVTESTIHLSNELLKVRERHWHPTALNFRSFKVNMKPFFLFPLCYYILITKTFCLEYCAIMNFAFHFHSATAYTTMRTNWMLRILSIWGILMRVNECEGCRCTFGKVRSSGMQL